MEPDSISALPMYDCFLPYESSDAIWWSIREGGALQNDSPKDLDRFSSCHSVWTAGPRLSLTQSCGYPLVRDYARFLQVVGVPVYAAPGCEGCTYRSAIIASSAGAADLGALLREGRELCMAGNSLGSFSGWLMGLSAVAEAVSAARSQEATGLATLKRVVLTGSHIGTLRAVQAGRADFGAVDCVSLALAAQHSPELLEGLKVIGWSQPAPALPFVTSAGASVERCERLRAGLSYMISSTEPKVVRARQQHLLVGVELGGGALQTYQVAVELHKRLVLGVPETAAVFCAPEMQPGGPPLRRSFTLPHTPHTLPRSEGAEAEGGQWERGQEGQEGGVRVQRLSRLEDRCWPEADFSSLNATKRFVAQFLLQTVLDACNDSDSPSDRPEGGAGAGPGLAGGEQVERLTAGLLVGTLRAVVGRQLWPVMPCGGKPKLILCTMRGALLLLLGAARGAGAKDPLAGAACWAAIATAASQALDAEGEGSHSHSDSNSSSNSEVGSAGVGAGVGAGGDPYFAGFMGAASDALWEYFPQQQQRRGQAECKDGQAEGIGTERDTEIDTEITGTEERGETVGAEEDGDGERADLLARLWAADLALSQQLLRVARPLGIHCYISAPRHNDRHDWANLVIADSAEGLVGWRDSMGHTAVRERVAPYTYEHIRLHRGQLSGGLLGPSLTLQRTVFLQPSSQPSTLTHGQESLRGAGAAPATLEAALRVGGGAEERELLERLSKPKQAQVTPSASGCPFASAGAGGCPFAPASAPASATASASASAPVVGFERHVVHWQDPQSDSPTAVPGGGGLTILEFKQMMTQGIPGFTI
ncbi:hypothetical protein B484DRAFT_449203 [Ochromonadaceae sp. CCMP2298]|nr:hypothetical protein B484DRAFT_449203 [Ochromonadaceae sp. CCMP2298]